MSATSFYLTHFYFYLEYVIARMKRDKAADLRGICVDHLLFSHAVLPCIWAKFFNLMMAHSHVPVSFGMSYHCLLRGSGLILSLY